MHDSFETDNPVDNGTERYQMDKGDREGYTLRTLTAGTLTVLPAVFYVESKTFCIITFCNIQQHSNTCFNQNNILSGWRP